MDKRFEGKVIVITGGAGGIGPGAAARVAPGGASQHAVVGRPRVAAREFIARGVRVNAVCPAPIETSMVEGLESGLNPDDPALMRARMSAHIPLGRYGRPGAATAPGA